MSHNYSYGRQPPARDLRASFFDSPDHLHPGDHSRNVYRSSQPFDYPLDIHPSLPPNQLLPTEQAEPWQLEKHGNPMQHTRSHLESVPVLVVDYHYGKETPRFYQAPRPIYSTAQGESNNSWKPPGTSQSDVDYRYPPPTTTDHRPRQDQDVPVVTIKMATSANTPTKKAALEFHREIPQTFPYLCSLCNITVLSKKYWFTHVSGTRHTKGELTLLKMYPKWDFRTKTVRNGDDHTERPNEKTSGPSHGSINYLDKPSSSDSRESRDPKTKVKSSRVLLFCPLPSVKKRAAWKNELLAAAKRFGPVERTLFLTSQAFVEMTHALDAQKLVEHHTSKHLKIDKLHIKVSFSSRYNTLRKSPDRKSPDRKSPDRKSPDRSRNSEDRSKRKRTPSPRRQSLSPRRDSPTTSKRRRSRERDSDRHKERGISNCGGQVRPRSPSKESSSRSSRIPRRPRSPSKESSSQSSRIPRRPRSPSKQSSSRSSRSPHRPRSRSKQSSSRTSRSPRSQTKERVSSEKKSPGYGKTDPKMDKLSPTSTRSQPPTKYNTPSQSSTVMEKSEEAVDKTDQSKKETETQDSQEDGTTETCDMESDIEGMAVYGADGEENSDMGEEEVGEGEEEEVGEEELGEEEEVGEEELGESEGEVGEKQEEGQVGEEEEGEKQQESAEDLIQAFSATGSEQGNAFSATGSEQGNAFSATGSEQGKAFSATGSEQGKAFSATGSEQGKELSATGSEQGKELSATGSEQGKERDGEDQKADASYVDQTRLRNV